VKFKEKIMTSFLYFSISLAFFIAIEFKCLGQTNMDSNGQDANKLLATAFESVWNEHDMQAFGKLLTDDVDWVNVDAGRGTGKELVVKGHERVHAGKFKESVITVKNVEVFILKPEVALVYVYWGIKGDKNNDGTEREPREGLFTWVTIKEGQDWKIRASHNTNKNVVK
jgi:uncharacterized protein (TIGR02246 family)